MAEIFLTGATGFIGRHLVPALIDQGHRLRCLVRAAEQAEFFQRLGCEVVVGDLLRLHPRSLGTAEVVIHLAALHRGSPTLIHRTNVEGTARLVQAAQSQRSRRFLYLSTVTAANRPAWPYAHSVWLAEQAIQNSSLLYTILRCSVIVGPGDPFLGGIVEMAQRWPVVPIIGSGSTKFQPISVHDIVRCICTAISSTRYDNKTLTVGGPEVLSYEQIVTTVLEALQLKKRKIHVPRRATRVCVRWLERCGVRTPFVPGHFLSHDHIAHSLTVIEDEFGFRPQTLRSVLRSMGCAPSDKSVL